MMLINETSKITNLTKKAIEYYIEQGLISPCILNNGYRDFNGDEIECLKKISVLRKLGLSTGEMKAVIADKNGDVLKKLSVQKELSVQRERTKNAILDKLSSGKGYDEISVDLEAIEQSATITEKLLDAFPGYYGRFICLHFARFLNESIVTEEQRSAYAKIIEFLDNIPPLNIPEDLQTYFNEGTEHIGTDKINEMIEKTTQSIGDPDKFLSDNKEVLEYYLSYMQSDEYKNSWMYQMNSFLKEFNKTSGYYDIFIPAMKKLSPSYEEYTKQMEIANEKLIAQYPEIEKLDNYSK
jgi:DNA-binding transcriptional MerR regulator